ncbi:MAG: FemAB family PEP-CTERM system-associated protein [Planctomycetaceae bacterium]|nr:FemAB family PEP-CTERM system-associated protein [Planctomycetaceae bacterium]
MHILARGLGHEPLLLEALRNGQVTGRLPLVLVRSLLFGRFLVSLPYVSTTGIQATEIGIGRQLIDEAVRQAAQQKCHHLALRHEFQWSHPALTTELNSKVHMRLELPQTSEDLWNDLKASVRNQVRKGQNQNLTVRWGSAELLNDFHAVFSRNMRDLGTPVYGRKLFAEILQQFGSQAEICTVSLRDRCVAAALLVHGSGTTVVPSASSLQKFNSTNANMLMYWNLLKRAVERGQQVFDFGRSTRNSGVYRFKKQWGARPHSACWQFHVRHGAPEQTRPESRRNQRLIRVWRRLPVCLTRIIGPRIVRGIP